ncbi:MAG: metalloregulator ArsR/SmtB family transcription factor [Planctomycetota bacterium]
MVECSARLDLVFSALADPTRRRILEMLSPRELRVSEIADSFAISLAAVSKHLRVLERAGLLSRRRDGRAHHLRAKPEAVGLAQAWIVQYARGWSDGFDALERYLKSQHGERRLGEPSTARTRHREGPDGG